MSKNDAYKWEKRNWHQKHLRYLTLLAWLFLLLHILIMCQMIRWKWIENNYESTGIIRPIRLLSNPYFVSIFEDIRYRRREFGSQLYIKINNNIEINTNQRLIVTRLCVNLNLRWFALQLHEITEGQNFLTSFANIFICINKNNSSKCYFIALCLY